MGGSRPKSLQSPVGAQHPSSSTLVQVAMKLAPLALALLVGCQQSGAVRKLGKDEQKEDEQAQEVMRERLGLHASAESHLAELVEEMEADPGCQNFFLSDGRDPVDLPSTWAEARESAGSICREEFEMPEEWCGDQVKEVLPESLLDDASMDMSSEMCGKLRQAVLAGRATSLEESVARKEGARRRGKGQR